MARAARLWRLLPHVTRRALLGVGLLSLLSSLAEIATYAALGAFLHLWAAGRTSLTEPALLFGSCALTSAAVRWWLQVRTARLAADAAHALSVEAKRRMLGQPLSFHHRFHGARAAATLEKVRSIAGAVLLPLIRVGQSALIGAALASVTIVTLPPAALGALALLGLFYALVAGAAGRATRRGERGLSARFDERARIVHESFAGIRDVILDRLAPERLGRFAKIDADIQHRLATFQSQAAAPRLLLEGAGMAAVALLIALLAAAGSSRALVPIGLLAFAAQRLLPLAHGAASGWQAWIANRSMIEDVAAILALPTTARTPGPPLRFAKDVELRGVRFAYPGAGPVIDDVSLRLFRGSRTGISGATGAGKSTLADILMGLLDPQRGGVFVDGHAIDADDAACWQANIAHVGQHLFLLDASIAENVALGQTDIDRERVRSALSAAALDEFAERLDEAVGEAGVRISGGQRQRLALARAHYKRAPIWILDEATGALDAETERRVLAAIPPDVTLLVISHRPAALAICERIFVMEDGRLRESESG